MQTLPGLLEARPRKKPLPDEPPGPLYTKWIKSRVEWYKRVLPRAPLTDEKLDLILPAAGRLLMEGVVSDALWTILLSNPDEKAMQRIEALARWRWRQTKGAFHPRPGNHGLG